MDIVTTFTLFSLAIFTLFFIPGFVVLSLIPSLRETFSSLEKIILSFTLGIVFIDILYILIGGMPFSFDRKVALSLVAIFLAAFTYLMKRSHRHEDVTLRPLNNALFCFSRKQILIFITLLALTFFVKVSYLSDTILPTSTDLAHHMYWTEDLMGSGDLPLYVEREIVETDSGYTLSESKPIADVIIGEHIPFAAIGILTKLSMTSSIPVLFLFIVHIFTLLALVVFAMRLFNTAYGHRAAQNIGLAVLLFAGPLYAIASPQAKFLSGGVVGNTFGNLFIPIILYCFFRAFTEKNQWLFTLGAAISWGLFYTHHLSGFIFLFIIVFSSAIFLLTTRTDILSRIQPLFRIIFSAQTIIFFIAATLLFLFIYAPSYITTGAVDTAVGGPSKSTRTGLTISQLISTVGEGRAVFAIIGALALMPLFVKKRAPYAISFSLGWAGSIFLMSFVPHLLMLDLPSNRIANYLAFPLIILAGLGLILVLQKVRCQVSGVRCAAFTLILTYLLFSGFSDNATFIQKTTNSQVALQTFSAATYVEQRVQPDENVIKDHNSLEADVWMKLIFKRDYNFPLSRGLLKRYEDHTKPRERCTLYMISAPNSDEGKKCYHDLNVRYAIVNAHIDSKQFEKLQNFSKVFESDDVAIFYRGR